MSTATMGPPQAPIDRVLARLAQRTGYEPIPDARHVGYWTCDCPIRHSEANTLRIRTAKDGRVLLMCRVGCSSDAIASAVDLNVSDLFPVAADVRGEQPDAQAAGLPPAIRAIDAPEPEPITWCVEELLVAGELAVCAGDGGSYKTTAAVHMAGAVAGGYSAFNRFPVRRSPALIVSAEDSAGVLLNRLDAIVTGHGWDRELVLSNVHLLATHDAKLSDLQWQQHLLGECARLEVGYVLFDPWADLISGEENSNSEQRPVIQFCRRVATQTNAAVVVNAHAAKVKEGQRSIDRVRGASALRDAARCVLFFESRPEGIAVEHLKMSRSEKLAPFMLTREIESSPDSRAVWDSARFSFQEVSTATLSRAESFVLDQVTMSPATLKTADLRTAAAGSGIRGEDVSRALSTLQARGLLDYDTAPRNAKLWRPVPQSSLSTPPWTGSENEPVQPDQSLSGRLQHTTTEPVQPAHPLRGGRQAGRGDRIGQAGQARNGVAPEPDAERDL